MNPTASCLSQNERTLLALFANGIIPANASDAADPAAALGTGMAEKIESGPNAGLYKHSLGTAVRLLREKFGIEPARATAPQIHDLLGLVRDKSPAFFKQLRMDVCALYLSDPAVWQRVGFPGPSIASGGYADFDQPQTEKITQLKEPAS